MPDDIRSIRKVSPSYVIAAGTQVVLKVSKVVEALQDEASQGTVYRKMGTVGVVVQCPPSNDEPYVVQFADGTTAKSYFHELTLRRKEVEMELERLEVDLLPFVIYRCQVGSKAFGLAGEDADDDLRGIYLPPASLHWGLRKLPEQLELGKASKSPASGGRQPPDAEGEADEPITDQVYWELEKFLLLALKANPNVLETLWTPVVHFATPLAEELRGLRQAFLSQHLYKTYSGYVLSQFRRMAAAHKTRGTFKTKHAMHLIRLLHSGIHALRTGEILIDVGEHRDELLGIKRGELSFDQVMQQALTLDKQFQAEFERTKLPQQPDFEAVNAFLVKARRSAVEVST
jgi:uncharacterized protein